MLLMKPHHVVITPQSQIDNILKSIELAGRLCYKSEDKITEDSAFSFVEKIIALGHESVLEHEIMSVQIVCDRGVSHELVRHRIASYSQESTRYCDYTGGNVTFVIPPWLNIETGIYHCMADAAGKVHPPGPNTDARIWFQTMFDLERIYKILRKQGWKPEEARSILPNSLKTEIRITMNLREWRHFFKLRTAKAAHPQMREIACPLLLLFQSLIPLVFDDIVPFFYVGGTVNDSGN